MRFRHSMIRVKDLDRSLDFYVNKLGLKEMRRVDVEAGRFTLVFLAAPLDEATSEEKQAPELELTYNWDPEDYPTGRNFGHLCYNVENIYDLCKSLQDQGVTILRPPREGRMAFVKCPDGISIELIQEGDALEEQEPWKSMENTGSW